MWERVRYAISNFVAGVYWNHPVCLSNLNLFYVGVRYMISNFDNVDG
jgi:hypothetical protein